jgi:hypothetical protein
MASSLLFIAGMGGLLSVIDVGIISAALLYLGKTVDLTVRQTSAIVAAVLGGSMLSSLVLFVRFGSSFSIKAEMFRWGAYEVAFTFLVFRIDRSLSGHYARTTDLG